MNSDVFDIVNDVVVLSPFNKEIPEFKLLKTKEELLYVYHMGSYRTPYANYDTGIREDKICKDFNIVATPYLKAAVIRFIEFQQTPTIKFLDANMKAMEKLRNFLETVDLNERDDKGKPIYKPYDLTAAMEKSGKIVEAVEQLKDKVKKELSVANAKIRGSHSVNKWEK